MRLPFAPTLDGAVIAANPEDPEAPVQSPVPLLTGYNADEGFDPQSSVTAAEFERNARSRYGSSARTTGSFQILR